MRVLVTGGAGFIGSVTTAYLSDCGFEVNILDDLSVGHRNLLDSRAKFFQGSILDVGKINEALADCSAVVHLAGKAIVEESTQNPDKYYLNNFIGTKNVLSAMIQNSIKHIVFASTCAVYGNPKTKLISEEIPPNPINPYGASKLVADLEISNSAKKYGLNSTSLRFFNVAGSYVNKENQLFGELHANETHLIPRILTSGSVEIYGTNLNTPDGTCVRDYVHVLDIARAIRLSLENKTNSSHSIYNLGTGIGVSVNDVIQAAESVLGKRIIRREGIKRSGDPEYLVSDPSLVKKELGWMTRYDLNRILSDSLKFIVNLS